MAMYNAKEIRLMAMFRGSMFSIIYRKTLSGNSSSEELDAVTLISTDVERTNDTLAGIIELWAHAVEIAIGIWPLWRQVGFVSIVPIVVVFVCFVMQGFVASFAGPRQALWVQAMQRRVGQTSSVLRSMKSVKLAGLADEMIELLQSERIRELNIGRSFRWTIVWQNSIGTSNPS
jgi:hypothetical protein